MSKSKVIYLVKMFRMRVVSRKPRNKSQTHTHSHTPTHNISSELNWKTSGVHYMDTGWTSVWRRFHQKPRRATLRWGKGNRTTSWVNVAVGRIRIYLCMLSIFCLTFWRYRPSIESMRFADDTVDLILLLYDGYANGLSSKRHTMTAMTKWSEICSQL